MYQPSVFLIQRKCPASLLMHELPLYGDSSIQTLIGQFGRDLPAKSLEGTELRRLPLSLRTSAWSGKRIVRSLLRSQKMIYPCNWRNYSPITNMLMALFLNLYKLATICLTILISTASVEQSFSDIKLIKNRLRNRLTELSLSNLMKIVTESPEKLTDNDLEGIVDMWNRKGRWIAV